MILDELILHDFGVYGGRQSVQLTPASPDRPIVLFGGLNGEGKTTLLDALQLSLFGPNSQPKGREGLSYDEYLRRSVHWGSRTGEAAVEIAFRQMVNGEEQRFRVHRSWTARNAGVRERLEVIRNDQLDAVATEQWSSQVEAIMPRGIAHLFLFDGEKVERYADIEDAASVIGAAIHGLLGLDIVERLSGDLLTLEKRKRAARKPAEARTELADRQAELGRLEKERARRLQSRAARQNEIDRQSTALDSLSAAYQREGGDLYDARERLEADLKAAERRLEAVRRDIRDRASGVAPLQLVVPLLKSVFDADAEEEAARLGRDALKAVADEHAALLCLPQLREAGLDLDRLAETLAGRRRDRSMQATGETIYQLSVETRLQLTALLQMELEETGKNLKETLEEELAATVAVRELRDTLAAAPDADVLASIHRERADAFERLNELTAAQREEGEAVAALDGAIAREREREERLLRGDLEERLAASEEARVLAHSERVRGVLIVFRTSVVARHLQRIESLILDSFSQLIRKSDLVAGLTIDPASFALQLHGFDGRRLTPDRLSAGERQLLATAMLWGLARASGRRLPTVIDTPLGRLDAQHRRRLVERYFPRASHQVILLSTDEEISQSHYQALAGSIGRSFRLHHREDEKRTVIEPGYFPGMVS